MTKLIKLIHKSDKLKTYEDFVNQALEEHNDFYGSAGPGTNATVMAQIVLIGQGFYARHTMFNNHKIPIDEYVELICSEICELKKSNYITKAISFSEVVVVRPGEYYWDTYYMDNNNYADKYIYWRSKIDMFELDSYYPLKRDILPLTYKNTYFKKLLSRI